MPLNIYCLADFPELIPVLVDWFYAEWGRPESGITPTSISKSLHRRLNRDSLPLALVALHGQEPVGSASIKIQEMETHPQYTHWLGSVYMKEEHRRQGFGSQLVEAAVQSAKSCAVKELYLYTRQSESLYASLGWTALERPRYHGREVVIMKRKLVD